jgi:hypothetical protein
MSDEKKPEGSKEAEKEKPGPKVQGIDIPPRPKKPRIPYIRGDKEKK